MSTNVKLDHDTLADVIYSSAMTLSLNFKSNKFFGKNSDADILPKGISFNLDKTEDLLVVGDKLLYDVKNDEFKRNKKDIHEAIKNRLIEVLKDKEIEFINQDPITKSVIVFTEDYIDKLVSKEEPIGNLIINYYKQWYVAKCGAGQKGTREHHERFKTFSQREIDYLKHMYIPIMIVSKDLKPIYNSVIQMMEISPLASYLVPDVGYNINGTKVEGSKTFWLPRIVAKEYLQETDDFKVLGISVINKLVRDSGLLGGDGVVRHKELSSEMFSDKNVKGMTDNFILSKHGLHDEEEEKKRVKQLISYDIDTRDNVIPEDAGDLSLDY